MVVGTNFLKSCFCLINLRLLNQDVSVIIVSNYRINWTNIGYSGRSVKLRSAKEGATLVLAAERRSDCDGRKDQLRRIRERPKTQVGWRRPGF